MSLQVALRNPNTVSTYVAPTSAKFVRSICIKRIKNLFPKVPVYKRVDKPILLKGKVGTCLGANARKILNRRLLVELFESTQVK